jgi:glycosyltransferase involved in cell wall biosynthesis
MGKMSVSFLTGHSDRHGGVRSSSTTVVDDLVGQSRTAEVAFVVPAHNEGVTVGPVVAACFQGGCALGRPFEVTVVADACSDDTVDVAAAAGATVIERVATPSKAHALADAVQRTRAPWLFFVDADCVGLTGRHLAAIADPVLAGRALMAVGVFDYGWLGPIVQRFPWSTGQRILPRAVFSSMGNDLRGYNIEVLVNEAIGKLGGTTVSFVMDGVRQRNKAAKVGNLRGAAANWRMWQDISRCQRHLDVEAYTRYMGNVVLSDRAGERPISRHSAVLGSRALQLAARLLDATTR